MVQIEREKQPVLGKKHRYDLQHQGQPELQFVILIGDVNKRKHNTPNPCNQTSGNISINLMFSLMLNSLTYINLCGIFLTL